MNDMKRRLIKGILLGIGLSISGCSTVGSTENCTEQYRDITIAEISQENQDAHFNLAGKITKKRPGQDWLLISDGTGSAKVHVAPSDDKLMKQQTNICLEFTARVSSVTNGENVDVTMYLGKYVESGK